MGMTIRTVMGMNTTAKMTTITMAKALRVPKCLECRKNG